MPLAGALTLLAAISCDSRAVQATMADVANIVDWGLYHLSAATVRRFCDIV